MLPKSFTRAWYEWLHAPAPYSNKYLNRQPSPSYNIELVLDHMETQLYMIGEGLISKKVTDVVPIALQQIAMLEQLMIEVENCTIPQDQKQQFKAYFEIVRQLWHEISKVGDASSQA